MDPIPVQTPAPGLAPSNSTYASGAGGALATLVIGVLNHFGWNVDSGTAVAIGALCAIGAGYLPASGRR